jgi:hypothetical protein
MAHVDIAACNSEGEVGTTLDFAQLASNSKNALVRHGVAKITRLRYPTWSEWFTRYRSVRGALGPNCCVRWIKCSEVELNLPGNEEKK